MLNFVIFGAPGSGKGTYSARLKEIFNLEHISTGDVLRGEIRNNTELGLIAKSYIDKGQLIPDDLMIGILANVYDNLPADSKGVILDGFPRTITQAEALGKMFEERNEKLTAVIDLEVSEDILLARLLRRAKLEGRADDNEETIKKRFEVYQKQTAPLIEWFEKEGIRNTFYWSNTPNKEDMIASIFKFLDTIK